MSTSKIKYDSYNRVLIEDRFDLMHVEARLNDLHKSRRTHTHAENVEYERLFLAISKYYDNLHEAQEETFQRMQMMYDESEWGVE